MFFTLLRLSLYEGRFDNSRVFANAKNTDWEQLFALAIRQGTVLLTYGGLQYLPAEVQPPRKLKLRWCANVIKGSERHDRYERVLAKLSHLFSANDIDLLVMKGLTISRLYPVPCYREGGDIDVYLFGKVDRADDLVSSHGITVKDAAAKHSAFLFDGLSVENHRTFFDTDIPFRPEALLYQKMENMLTGLFSKEFCPPMHVGSARQLPAQAAALHLIGHTFRHFCCFNINVRQLCDWTVFFSKCEKEIDKELLVGQIRELGLENFVTAIHSFCAEYLGFKPTFLAPKKRDKKSERLVLKIVLNYRVEPGIHIPVIGALNFITFKNRIYRKYLGRIGPSEFLLPGIKSYFYGALKRIKRSGDSK